jgi:hypothetical protein
MSQIRYALFFSVSFLLFSPSIMRVRIDETRAERFVVLTEGLITNVPYLSIYGVVRDMMELIVVQHYATGAAISPMFCLTLGKLRRKISKHVTCPCRCHEVSWSHTSKKVMKSWNRTHRAVVAQYRGSWGGVAEGTPYSVHAHLPLGRRAVQRGVQASETRCRDANPAIIRYDDDWEVKNSRDSRLVETDCGYVV